MKNVRNVYDLVKFLDENYNTGSSYNPFEKKLICMGSDFDSIREVVVNWALENGFTKPSGLDYYVNGEQRINIYSVKVGILLEIKPR